MPANPISVTISSVGTSRHVNLDWMVGGQTTVKLSAGSTTMSGGGQMQFTLDDVTMPSTSVVWTGLSSAFGSSLAALTVTASGIADVPIMWLLSHPCAGLRFSCSAISSSQFLLEILQGHS